MSYKWPQIGLLLLYFRDIWYNMPTVGVDEGTWITWRQKGMEIRVKWGVAEDDAV